MSEFNPLQMAKDSKTFCIFPWIHQYVGPPGDILPCCVYDDARNFTNNQEPLASLKSTTLKEAWNNERTKSMRLKFLNGEQDSGCSFCNNRIAGDAFYNSYNRQYLEMDEVRDVIASTQPDGSLPDHKLFYIDARWNNLCNFKCRSCSPHYSTSWIEDHKKLYLGQGDEYTFSYSGKTEDDLLEQILPHLQTVKMIYFAGGEPMMQKDHYEVLLKLIELGRTDVIIKYNTNFSQLQLKHYDNVLNYWKQFKHIEIGASIDGSYKRAEYWRHGTKWDKILDNVKRLKSEVPHARLTLSYTLSWINAHNFVELHKEWVNLGYINLDNVTLNSLNTPPYYSLKFIPEWKKREIEKLLLDHIEWAKQFDTNSGAFMYLESIIKNAIHFMNDTVGHNYNEQEMMKDFVKYTNRLDEIRNENFYETFPEHTNMKQVLQWT